MSDLVRVAIPALLALIVLALLAALVVVLLRGASTTDMVVLTLLGHVALLVGLLATILRQEGSATAARAGVAAVHQDVKRLLPEKDGPDTLLRTAGPE